jgi:serine/threonine protein kinase
MVWRLSGFDELGRLGGGASGHVVSARHQATGTVVAIKYLSEAVRRAPGALDEIRAAVAALVETEEPGTASASSHIVNIHEYIEAPRGTAIVMELLDGATVAELIRHEGAAEPEAALHLLRGVLTGLAAAHARGVMHGGVRPTNVLVDPAGTSRLVDFAVPFPPRVPIPAYVAACRAPELSSGAPDSPRSDIYAATATTVALLTARPSNSYAPPMTGVTDSTPQVIRDLIASGLAEDPQERPGDVATFLAELDWAAADAYGPEWAETGQSRLVRAVSGALVLIGAEPAAIGFGQTLTAMATRYLGGPVATRILAGAGLALVLIVGTDRVLSGPGAASVASGEVPSFTLNMPTTPSPAVTPSVSGPPTAKPTASPTVQPVPTLIGLDPTHAPVNNPPPRPAKTPSPHPTTHPPTHPPTTHPTTTHPTTSPPTTPPTSPSTTPPTSPSTTPPTSPTDTPTDTPTPTDSPSDTPPPPNTPSPLDVVTPTDTAHVVALPRVGLLVAE